MIVASTMVPPATFKPRDARCSFARSNSSRPREAEKSAKRRGCLDLAHFERAEAARLWRALADIGYVLDPWKLLVVMLWLVGIGLHVNLHRSQSSPLI